MGFGVLYKRPYNDHEDPFVYVETDATGSIVEESWDNGLNHRVTVSQIGIENKANGESRFSAKRPLIDDEYSFYITESRLIFQKQSLKNKLKFDGSLIDYGIDALFKKHEDKKAEGLQIIGQIRYEWLAQIMYFEKAGWNNDNMMRFSYYDGNKTLWRVSVVFKHDMDVRFLANEILHMACNYKLQMRNNKSEKLLEFLKKYVKGEITHDPTPKNFSSIAFPSVLTACYGRDERPIIG